MANLNIKKGRKSDAESSFPIIQQHAFIDLPLLSSWLGVWARGFRAAHSEVVRVYMFCFNLEYAGPWNNSDSNTQNTNWSATMKSRRSKVFLLVAFVLLVAYSKFTESPPNVSEGSAKYTLNRDGSLKGTEKTNKFKQHNNKTPLVLLIAFPEWRKRSLRSTENSSLLHLPGCCSGLLCNKDMFLPNRTNRYNAGSFV